MLTSSGAKEMVIKINDIPPEGMTIEFAQKLDLFNKGTASTAITAILSIKPGGEGVFRVTGRVQADPVLECSRCLKCFPYHVDAKMGIDLAPMNTLKSTPEHELNPAELDTEFYEGEELEPAEFIKEQVLITIPMVPLHHPDCKGLCPACGTDLNEADCGCRKDNRGEFGAFSALKDLFKK
jgi:uncharacterized protein